MDTVSRTQNSPYMVIVSVSYQRVTDRYADNYKAKHGKCLYALSEDLYNWSAMTELPDQSQNVRHGTVLLQRPSDMGLPIIDIWLTGDRNKRRHLPFAKLG
jgi:hypothetical protein